MSSRSFKQYMEHHHILGYGVFLLLIIPIFVIGYAGYTRMDDDLTNLTLSRRQAITDLAANAIKTKLDRIVDIGVSLANEPDVRDAAIRNDWPAALAAVTRSQRAPALSDDFIDRIVITDKAGIEEGAYPVASAEIGRNLSFRDWFNPIAKENAPWYVSNAYHRTPPLEYNVVGVAVPIRDAQNELRAILVLQIPINKFLDLTGGIDVGANGFAYLVDARGQIVAHPKYDLKNGEVANYGDVPAVQAALRGEKGIKVFYNQIEREERLTAYRQIDKYRWVVIVQQPTTFAFQERDDVLNQLKIAVLAAFAIVLVLAYAVAQGMKPTNPVT